MNHLNEIKSLVDQAKKLAQKTQDDAAKHIAKVDDPEYKAFFQDAMKKAQAGELSMNDYLAGFNKIKETKNKK